MEEYNSGLLKKYRANVKAIAHFALMTLLAIIFRYAVHYMRVISGEQGNSYSYLELCNEARQNGNMYIAEEQCGIAAQMGNKKGIFNLAEIDMQKGNIKEAHAMLEKINSDSPKDIFGNAQKKLGDIYRIGIGEYHKDLPKAFRFYKTAAEEGNNPEAMYWVGHMYDNGLAVKENSTDAANYFRKSAELGYAPAQNALGIMYLNGYGVRGNYD